MDIEIFNKAKSEDPERMKQYLNDNKKMLIEAVNSGRIDKDIGMILQWFDMYYGQQNSLEDILKSWGFTSLQVDALMAQYGIGILRAVFCLQKKDTADKNKKQKYCHTKDYQKSDLHFACQYLFLLLRPFQMTSIVRMISHIAFLPRFTDYFIK